ncbi:DUF488 domain-containing protein [Polaromonas jejuensis]|nr:DUF488 family protein [Polaromonas jejuensis]
MSSDPGNVSTLADSTVPDTRWTRRWTTRRRGCMSSGESAMHASPLIDPAASPGSGDLGRAHRAVAVKRARESASVGDGMRVLVDRLWPRGLAKQQLVMDLWLKDVAPSSTLRRWYGHDPSRWEAFARKYRVELAQRDDLLQLLDDLRRRGKSTLLCDARDSLHSHAIMLRELLIERCFPRHNAKGVEP